VTLPLHALFERRLPGRASISRSFWLLAVFQALVAAALADVHYVSLSSPAPAPPYSSWETAATNIQDAADAAYPGDTVLVTNGVYGTGGRVIAGLMSNRVAVVAALRLVSVNGAATTTIMGSQMPGTLGGDSAIRCVYLADGASLVGFTLAGGATRTDGDDIAEQSGGGAWCASTNVELINCVIVSNTANMYGGGCFSGTLYESELSTNQARTGGGAVAVASLYDCRVCGNLSYSLGGGAYSSVIEDSTIAENSAPEGGGTYLCTVARSIINANSASRAGGALQSSITDCTLAWNKADLEGGGAYGSVLVQSTVSSNSASFGGGAHCSTLGACRLEANSSSDGGATYESTLENCILRGNSASSTGGGAWGGVLTNCSVLENSASAGGGAVASYLENSLLSGNVAQSYGGGADGCTLHNCTVTENWGDQGGGVYGGCSENCIVYYNKSRTSGNNYIATIFSSSCTQPLPDTGSNNISADPLLANSFLLSAISPCRGAGDATSTGVDIDGEPWANPPSMGCDEFWLDGLTGPLKVRFTATYSTVTVDFTVDFTAQIEGRPSSNSWDFGDGIALPDRPVASHAWSAPGDYLVTLRVFNLDATNGSSVSMPFHVLAPRVLYVAGTSTNSLPPYGSWETAARNIQDAVDIALPGERVIVTNGFYIQGGRAVDGPITNRVAVLQPIRLESVNGPEVTTIVGLRPSGGGNGDGALRCAYLTNGAVLAGFTLAYGGTRSNGDVVVEQSGGGVWCASTNETVTNCILSWNSANYEGGGAFSGTLKNCRFVGNSASSGGGASCGALYDCALNYNSAENGGGAFSCTMVNCMLVENSASTGGGVASCSLEGCTVVGNDAQFLGGGASASTIMNSIVFYNVVFYHGVLEPPNVFDSSMTYSCSTPLSTGIGNTAADPAFVDYFSGNLRLQASSPCVDAGTNSSTTSRTDLDGRPRVVGLAVDMGAYEFQPNTDGAFIGWLQRFLLPTDGSVDYGDQDGDGMNNWQEWRAGTDPTNSASVLRLLAVTTNTNLGVTLTWESATGVLYDLERSTGIGAQATFMRVATGIVGQDVTTSFTETNAAGGYRFYRVAIHP